MADILCIGLNDILMQTRTLILEKAGYAVTPAYDIRQVQAACETNSFAVAILGQSLNPSEKMRIADVIFKHCGSARILELHTAISAELPEADAHLQVNAIQPEGLIEAVAMLLRTPRKKRARSGN